MKDNFKKDLIMPEIPTLDYVEIEGKDFGICYLLSTVMVDDTTKIKTVYNNTEHILLQYVESVMFDEDGGYNKNVINFEFSPCYIEYYDELEKDNL